MVTLEDLFMWLAIGSAVIAFLVLMHVFFDDEQIANLIFGQEDQPDE